MSGASRPREHLAFLDGLRALLALYVVQRHAEVFFWRVTESHQTKGLSPWIAMRYAHFAVDMFIVISGFCLFLPVIRAAGELRGGAAIFFQRRALRILPPYYAALGFSMLGLWWAGQARQFTGPNLPKVWHHLLLVHDALSPFAINSALWSVAVEFHIYLLFPLLVVSWRRLGPAVTTAWAALASAALYAFLLGSPYRVITPHYLLLFVLGMAAAAIYASPRWAELARLPWGIAPAILIPFAMAFHHFGPPRLVDRFLGVEDTVVGVGTAALLLAAARPGPVAQALSVGPLVRIGGFSYSVYLAHIPLLELIAHATGWNFQATGGLLKVAQMAMLVALATAGSYAFYLAFERPVVRLLSARRPAPAPT